MKSESYLQSKDLDSQLTLLNGTMDNEVKKYKGQDTGRKFSIAV